MTFKNYKKKRRVTTKTKRSLYRNVFNDQRADDIGRCEPHEKKKKRGEPDVVCTE